MYIKIMRYVLFTLISMSAIVSHGNENKDVTVVLQKVQDGTFVLSNRYQETILELKSGSFRYWNASDVKMANEPEYPVIGKYISGENSIKLVSTVISPYHINWTFKKINNTITIWTDFANETYLKGNELHSYGILRQTNKTAEQILKDHAY